MKRKRERKRKKSHNSYKKIYRYKIDNKYQKAKIKNLEQSLECQKYKIKEKKKKKVTKIIKKIYIGTKLITNTKKLKLKIQSRDWNFKNTMLKKRRKKKKRKEEGKGREKKRTKKNKQGRENYKETTGTKLITNTKKQKLKIQSRV